MNLGRRGVKQFIVLLTCAALVLLGYARASASVTISSFKAQAQGAAIQLVWTTATEVDNAGFYVLRSNSASSGYAQITASLIPSKCVGCVTGASYSYTDSAIAAGQTYYYKLESVDTRGGRHQFGPVTAGSSAPTATPVASSTPLKTKTPGASPTALRTNTPVPGSTPTRAATLTATPRSVAAQPTSLTKVAIAVTGGTASPVRVPSGTRVSLAAPTTVPSPVMIAIKLSDEDDASETESSASPAPSARPHPLVSATILGAAGMFGCGALVLAAFACLICAGIIRRAPSRA